MQPVIIPAGSSRGFDFEARSEEWFAPAGTYSSMRMNFSLPAHTYTNKDQTETNRSWPQNYSQTPVCPVTVTCCEETACFPGHDSPLLWKSKFFDWQLRARQETWVQIQASGDKTPRPDVPPTNPDVESTSHSYFQSTIRTMRCSSTSKYILNSLRLLYFLILALFGKLICANNIVKYLKKTNGCAQ